MPKPNQIPEIMKNDFFITDEDQEHAIYSKPLTELFIKENMDVLVALYSPHFKALHPTATAAGLARWFASIPLAFQYALSVMNQSIDLSPQNITVQIYSFNGVYWFSFKLNQYTTRLYRDEIPREDWLYQQLVTFYSDTMRPLLETMAESVQMNIGQLWGQFPRKFDIFVEKWKQAIAFGWSEQIDRDYQFLAENMEPEVFGRKRNPFHIKQRLIRSLDDETIQIPVECTCCLNYLREGGQLCFTCPRLKEQDRETMRKKRKEELEVNE
ncbi:Ferric iron reductase protein FhuF, involved in iron transport [Salinibacillus kushneri]|uniref:Ferric iron reductase protein FhuF, involved in iron transport n=1 Tax=Salinibacillus kushneri TaxID=237682 RepID=A0A1I0BB47_9BACI|nr:(2Fe-2S)-binding protein [Salinibacillus kushneri]SET03769.1 Ferric iron reductase protein FhuF, involved in iron transport [Salinibacillus kushneri]